MPLNKDGTPQLYKPWVNKTKSRFKYWVYVRSNTKKGYKKIGFGHKDYEDYTQHRDKERQRSYLARAKGIKNKKGELTYTNPESPNYHSRKILW